jgi:indole-3-glycerol phosphate synthase
MADFLDTLTLDAKRTIAGDYYAIRIQCEHKPLSLRKSILGFNMVPVIAEIKLASPTLGIIREDRDAEALASSMEGGGAVGISVLTEPKRFMGSLSAFIKVRKTVNLPLLMKDIFLSRIQIDAASAIGADAILLIKALFDRGYCECDISDMIEYAHSKEIEVLLETHSQDEFSSTLDSEADLVGINNRDLRTLNVDIDTTRKILQRINPEEKVVVSESGIKTPSEIRYLHTAGAQAFLVGSALMTSDDVRGKVRELVTAL